MALLFRDMEDILQSALSFPPLINEGIINVIKRELRYILEMVCIHYFIYNEYSTYSFEGRLNELERLGTQAITMKTLKRMHFHAFSQED